MKEISNEVRISNNDYVMLKNQIFNDITDGKTPVDHPKAYITAGQPGAGKTNLRNQVLRIEQTNNFVELDNDYIKKQHPNLENLQKLYGKDVMNYIHPFASELLNDIQEELINSKYNIIFEATCKNIETPMSAIKQYASQGYEVNMCVVGVHKKLSELGIKIRYEDQFKKDPITARDVPESVHQQAVDNLPAVIDALYQNDLLDNLYIFNRDGKELYNSNNSNKTPYEVLNNAINNDLDEKMYQQEFKHYIELKRVNDDTRKLMEKGEPVNKLKDYKVNYKDVFDKYKQSSDENYKTEDGVSYSKHNNPVTSSFLIKERMGDNTNYYEFNEGVDWQPIVSDQPLIKTKSRVEISENRLERLEQEKVNKWNNLMDHVRLSNQQPLDPVRDSAYIKKLQQKEDAFFNVDKEIHKQGRTIDRLSKLDERKKAGVDKYGLPVNTMANYDLIKSMVELHEKYTDKKFEFYIPKNKNNMVYRLPDSDPLRAKQIKRDELYAQEIDALEHQFGVKLKKEINTSQYNTLVKRLDQMEITKEVYAKYDNNDVFWDKISNGEIKPWSNNERYLFVNSLKKVALFLDEDEIRVSNKYPATTKEEQEKCQQIIEDIDQYKQNGLLKNYQEIASQMALDAFFNDEGNGTSLSIEDYGITPEEFVKHVEPNLPEGINDEGYNNGDEYYAQCDWKYLDIDEENIDFWSESSNGSSQEIEFYQELSKTRNEWINYKAFQYNLDGNTMVYDNGKTIQVSGPNEAKLVNYMEVSERAYNALVYYCEKNYENKIRKNNNERGNMQETYSYACDCASILIGLDKENPNSAFDISNHLGDGEGEIIINTEKSTDNPMISKHDRGIVGGFIKGDNFSLFLYDCAKYNTDKKIKDKSIPLSLDSDQWYCFESIDDDMDISLYKCSPSDIRKYLQLNEEPSYLIEENGNTVIVADNGFTHYGETSNVKLLNYDNGEYNVTDIDEEGFGRQVFNYDQEEGLEIYQDPWYDKYLLSIDTDKNPIRDGEKQLANMIGQEFDIADYEISVDKDGSKHLVGEYRSNGRYHYHEFSELKMADVDKNYNQNNYYKKVLDGGSERFGSLGKDIHVNNHDDYVYIVKNQEVAKSFKCNHEDDVIKYNNGCYQLDSDASKER